ncbi:MAG: hypothetical protein VX938_07985, partial [Myxococcota bacterium]|nr:hypothetical protein [Myxococcota bacterium]
DGESYLQGGGGAGQGVYIPGTPITGQGNFKFQNKQNTGDLPITMSAWIYMEEVPTDEDWSWPIIAKGARTEGSTGGSCFITCGEDTDEEWIFGVRHDGERPVLFYKVVDEEQQSSTSFAGTGPDAWERVSAPLSDHPQGADIRNRWLHVAVVYDGNPDGQTPAMGEGRARLFLNGEPLEGLGHDHNSSGASKYNHIVHSADADVHIGREASGHVARGQMDDLFVTKTVLSDADVAFLYGHGCPPDLPSSHVWDTDTGLVLATMGEDNETVSLSGNPTYKFLQGSLTTFIMNCPNDKDGKKAPFTDGVCESKPMHCPASCDGGPDEQTVKSGAVGLGCPVPTTCGFECTWGDHGNDDFQDAAVDGYGDVIVVGKNCSENLCNPMVMRFSPEGDLLAHAELQGLLDDDLPSLKPFSVAIGPDDSIYVAGEASELNTSNFRGGFVTRLSPSLSPVWVYLHKEEAGAFRDVTVDPGGRVLAVGFTEPDGKEKPEFRDGLMVSLASENLAVHCQASVGISGVYDDGLYGVELLDGGHVLMAGSLVAHPETDLGFGLIHVVSSEDENNDGYCDSAGGNLPFIDENNDISNQVFDVT